MRSYTRPTWAVAGALALLAIGCSANEPADDATTLVVLGDSLAEESMPYVHLLTSDKEFDPNFFGGTAPCDWIDDDVEASAESIVILTFTGNSQTPCMSDGAGGFLAGQAMIDKYRTDVGSLIDKARDDGARVVLVGQPVRRDDVGGNDEVDGLNAVYRDLANAEFVSYVDAGAAVENPDGTYAQTLPCAQGESDCDPSGANVVRNDDGLHFCPGGPREGNCEGYASGAYRFAAAIVAAVNDPEAFESA